MFHLFLPLLHVLTPRKNYEPQPNTTNPQPYLFYLTLPLSRPLLLQLPLHISRRIVLELRDFALNLRVSISQTQRTMERCYLCLTWYRLVLRRRRLRMCCEESKRHGGNGQEKSSPLFISCARPTYPTAGALRSGQNAVFYIMRCVSPLPVHIRHRFFGKTILNLNGPSADMQPASSLSMC